MRVICRKSLIRNVNWSVFCNKCVKMLNVDIKSVQLLTVWHTTNVWHNSTSWNGTFLNGTCHITVQSPNSSCHQTYLICHRKNPHKNILSSKRYNTKNLVLPVPFCLSYSACPVLSFLLCLSRSVFSILPVPFCLSDRTGKTERGRQTRIFCCTVLKTICFVTVFSVTNMFGDMYCFETVPFCNVFRLRTHRLVMDCYVTHSLCDVLPSTVAAPVKVLLNFSCICVCWYLRLG